jgi:phytoene dehydrogenase-like protein
MAAKPDPSIEAFFQQNVQLLAQTQEVSQKLRQLMANPVRQKLRELGVQDEEAFFAWLEKQTGNADMAQAERLAREQLAQLLAPPVLAQPEPVRRVRRLRQMV